MTYFPTGDAAVSLAQRRFTVLFGMGRGGTTSLWPPDVAGSDEFVLLNSSRYSVGSKLLFRCFGI